jgi:hypothetical protein
VQYWWWSPLGSAAETSTGAACLNGILRTRNLIAVLTISRLKRWSIRYYNDTATTAKQAGLDAQAADGGLGNTIPRPTPGSRRGSSLVI